MVHDSATAAAAAALSRRAFLQRSAGAAALAALPPWPARDLPPVRQITRGPKHHWFGYYDKLEFDPTGRLVLGMAVAFEHRSPKPDDAIEIGVVDLDDGDRWHRLGSSRSWGWQQGCMLQFRPGFPRQVLWNDRDGDGFVCRIHDLDSGETRTISHAVYTVSPDGRTAMGLDFARVQHMRPGYGYAGVPDPNHDVDAPDGAGVYRIDLDSGAAELVVSIASLADRLAKDAAREERDRGLKDAKHYVNHLLIDPAGARFIVLHRWRPGGRGGFRTRMLTAKLDGGDLRVVDDSGRTSHFIWRDPEHILAWTRHPSAGDAFYLFEDAADGAVEVVGKGMMTRNGHCTYLPGNAWILNDTYPDRERLQHPYLFEVATGRVVPLGHFKSPKQYRGEWRCDLHPRSSPDGKSVVIDSPHTGAGRQLHRIDIAAIVG